MICASFTRVRRVLRDLIIISHLFEFVKGFLKSFLNFFRSLSSRFFSALHTLAEVPDYYITSKPLCQGVLQKFFNFFVIFSRCCPPGTCAPLVASLHIISLHFPFVKRFFPSFSTLESIAFCHKFGIGKLCNITKSKRCPRVNPAGKCFWIPGFRITSERRCSYRAPAR